MDNGQTLPPSLGPFYTVVIGDLASLVLLIAVWSGMPFNDRTFFRYIIPGMVVTFLAMMASLGWMFLLAGRFHRPTRWVWPTSVAIGVGLLELFLLTYAAGQVQG